MRKTSTIKIGKNMQQIRKSFGYTQEKLAEQIEVSTRYVSEIEQDRVNPSYEVIVRFCNVFGIGLDYWGRFPALVFTNIWDRCSLLYKDQSYSLVFTKIMSFLVERNFFTKSKIRGLIILQNLILF